MNFIKNVLDKLGIRCSQCHAWRSGVSRREYENKKDQKGKKWIRTRCKKCNWIMESHSAE